MAQPPRAASDADDALPDFPRPGRAGTTTQHLLVTLVVEVWWHPQHEWLPARVITRLAADLGISAGATQSALSRLAARRVLEQANAGRYSTYRLTPAARVGLLRGLRQVARFGRRSDWDRRWTVLTFSVPESDRDRREYLRGRLEWLGFGSLYAGMWLSARVEPDDLEAVCREAAVTDYVVMTVCHDDIRGKDPVLAWDLEQVRQQYRPFLQWAEGVEQRLRTGRLSDEECFGLRIRLVDRWRAFPWEDPDLPSELLGGEWTGTRAAQQFRDLYAGLAPGALAHARTVVSELAPELTELVSLQTLPV